MQRKLLMKGKVKEAYDLGDRLEFRFTDNISVFDKVIPSLIPFKGETLSRAGVYLLETAARMYIKTHFLEYLAPAGMLCKKVDIIQSSQITGKSRNYLIPLEWICRWYVAGSLFDRINEGKVSAESLGFASGHKVIYGEILPDDTAELAATLEGQLVRVADIMAYVNHDMDDALRAEIIRESDIPPSLVANRAVSSENGLL